MQIFTFKLLDNCSHQISIKSQTNWSKLKQMEMDMDMWDGTGKGIMSNERKTN